MNEIKITKTVYSFNLNYTDYVSIKCDVSAYPLTFLCDSQADISVIKISAVEYQLRINGDERINIKGVTKDIIESIGTVQLELRFESTRIKFKFHVVPDEFNVPSNGIIGRDFNKFFNCKLYYADMTFTVRFPDIDIILNITSEPAENRVALPARCETFRIFRIQNFCGLMVIPAHEISSGIFIPNTIAHNQNPVIRVLNTNEDIKVIENELKNVLSATEFDFYSPKYENIAQSE